MKGKKRLILARVYIIILAVLTVVAVATGMIKEPNQTLRMAIFMPICLIWAIRQMKKARAEIAAENALEMIGGGSL